MLASDGGSPSRSDSVVVDVNVQRNLNHPEFNPVDYDVEILELQRLGVPFVTVSAFDSDYTVSI